MPMTFRLLRWLESRPMWQFHSIMGLGLAILAIAMVLVGIVAGKLDARP